MSHKKKPAVHVTPRDEGWAVTREENKKATSVLPTQKLAEDKGRNIARKDRTEFYLQDKQGQVRARDSYSDDPYPPEG